MQKMEEYLELNYGKQFVYKKNQNQAKVKVRTQSIDKEEPPFNRLI